MARLSLRLCVAFLVLVPAIAAAGDSLSSSQIAAVDAAVAAEMEKQQALGVAIGVLLDGRIAYLKGYGVADRERNVPVTTETVFNWASNSKPLAAVAAMQLVEKGKLDLDADVRTYVPEFPDKGTVVTARHLLCHQSGIPHYSNGQVTPTEREYPIADPFNDPVFALDKFNGSPLLYSPGEKVSYSSYAYVLLSAVIQRAGNQPFAQQIDERIAKPLRLGSLQYDVATAGQPHWATGYMKNKAGDIVPSPEEAHYWKHGAGGFKSNVTDFARWAEGLLNRRLVATETETIMWTCQTCTDGSATKWGLGFVVEKDNGLKISHGGSQKETKTRMVLSPGSKSGIVVMCNCDFANPTAFSTAVDEALKAAQ